MTVIGFDDTDSRAGMCSTYVATVIADRLRAGGADVRRVLLVRLNPAIEHKTRGNAALAIHTDAEPAAAFEVAREAITELAETDDPGTNPGLVVADIEDSPSEIPEPVVRFGRAALRERLDIERAATIIGGDHGPTGGFRDRAWGNGRGRIGALAAVGAWGGLGDRSYELIAYRQPERWGTPREVDHESVFAAADARYPAVWDTVDRAANETVCVPHTPGPVLYGIRGDDPEACRAVAERIGSEPIARSTLFVTNQGTDAHLRSGEIGALADGRSYRVDGVVRSAPETKPGGHVFFGIAAPVESDGHEHRTCRCVAFEPTERFRDRVRALRIGDRLTVCGELSEGTLKLEKFALREPVRTERVTPTCPDCGRRMESAGREQGYRCRDCRTHRDRKAKRELERELEVGWYEVPPCARRHIAKPLVRGGFDAPVHPER